MDAPRNKKPFAELFAGVTGADIQEAIQKSGYPLQASVADALRTKLAEHDQQAAIQEEWAFVDPETQQARSIDIFADLPMYKFETEANRPKVLPYLTLLMECKQSELPYVFFLRGDSPGAGSVFPEISGIQNESIRVFSKGDEYPPEFSYEMSIHDVLGAYDLDFLDSPTFYAISAAKAVRRGGSKLELTGEDAYRAITLPLLKAADHVRLLSAPKISDDATLLRFIVCVAVVKAPMIGSFLHDGKSRLLSLPWVRSSRLEPITETSKKARLTSIVRHYDIIHESFLPAYLDRLIPDMREISKRVVNIGEVIVDGYGMAGDADETYMDIEPLPSDRHQHLKGRPFGAIRRGSGGLGMQIENAWPEDEIAHIDFGEYCDDPEDVD
ncbi:hypothetical protein ACIRVF_12175 [Kitasatospora sp. NPDC101157]|uniref:hypothetical protein n=1 Tax=Kitasatospora sp. NPDC101157 TaxID=3364098 RepID=UPI0037FF572C